MDDLNFPDYAEPHFAVPELEVVDLATPGFIAPDVNRADPQLADLMLPLIPGDLDRLPVEKSDPASPDLTLPDIPGELDRPDVHSHSLTDTLSMPAVTMDNRPGELSDPALSLVRTSPDYRELPSNLSYRSLYTNDQDMTTRHRHLGMLELGLLGESFAATSEREER